MEYTLKEEIQDKFLQISESISIIEERCKNIQNVDDFPWAKVIGLRNIISHEYANIDYEIIWVVIQKHLPPLKETVEQIIKDLS